MPTPHELSNQILASVSGPADAGFVESIVEDTKKSFRAAGMMLKLYTPVNDEERKDLNRRFMADAALLGASALTGMAAGAALKGVGPIARAILGGALTGAAGTGAFAAVEGEPILPSMGVGAALGGVPTGALAKVSVMGKRGAAAAARDAALMGRRALVAKNLKELASLEGGSLPLVFGRKAMPELQAEMLAARRSPEAQRIQHAFDEALRISTDQFTFEGDVPVTIQMGRFPGNKAGFRIIVDPKAGTAEQRAAAHEAARNMMLGSGVRPEMLFSKGIEEIRQMTAGLPGKPMLDTAAGAELRIAFKNFLREKAEAPPPIDPTARMPRLPGGRTTGRMGRRAFGRMMNSINTLVDEFVGEEPGPRGIAVAGEVARKLLLKLPYGERVLPVFNNVASLLARSVVAAGDVVEKMGPAGAELAQKMSTTLDRGTRIAANDIIAIEGALRKMPLRERINVAHSLHGDDVPMNDNIQVIVDDIRTRLEKVGTSAQEVQLRVYNPATGKARPFELRKSYFPLDYSDKTIRRYLTNGTPEREEALKMLMRGEQAVSRKEAEALLSRYLHPHMSEFNYGHLQIARSIAIPGWEEDPLKVLPQYFLRSWKRIEIAREFGPKHELARKLWQQIGADGHDWRTAAQTYRAFADAEPLGLRELANATRSFNILTLLSTSGLVQFSQHTNTIAYTGYKNYMQGLATFLSRDPQARELAARTGAYMGEMLQDVIPYGDRGLTSRFLGFPGIGLSTFDKINRIVAAFAGMYHADEQAAKLFAAYETGGALKTQLQRDITRMGLKVEEVIAQKGILAPEQRLIAGQQISHATQFRGSVLDLPLNRHSTMGQFIYLFKTFTLQQGRFVAGLMAEGKQGNWAPMMRYLAATGVFTTSVGEAVATARQVLSGKERAQHDLAYTMIENAAIGGALGIASDMSTAMANGPDFVASLIAGPNFKQLFDLIGRDIPEAVRGRPEVILHDTLRHIPLFGKRVADWLVPLD